MTTACILGSDYSSNCFWANELFRPVRARRVFGVLNFTLRYVALVLKVHDCASWSGLLSWLDFYCGRSPSPVIEPPMHGFCVSAGLGPSICAAHVWRSLGGVHSGDPGWEARVLPPCVATPAGFFYAGVQGPLPAPRFPGTSVCKIYRNFLWPPNVTWPFKFLTARVGRACYHG